MTRQPTGKDRTLPPGRPRDNATTPAVLAATRALIIKHGFNAVTIDVIAKTAGVARQTIYRRWSSKALLVLETFFASAGSSPIKAGGNVRTTLFEFALILFKNLETDGPAIGSLIAAAQEDAEFRAAFVTHFIEPRARMVMEILSEGQSRGEIPTGADIRIASDMFHGAFWYRLLQGAPLDREFAQKLTDQVINGLNPQSV